MPMCFKYDPPRPACTNCGKGTSVFVVPGDGVSSAILCSKACFTRYYHKRASGMIPRPLDPAEEAAAKRRIRIKVLERRLRDYEWAARLFATAIIRAEQDEDLIEGDIEEFPREV